MSQDHATALQPGDRARLISKKKIKNKKDIEWQNSPKTCCLQETRLTHKYSHKLKVKDWKKIFHSNGHHKQARVAIFISDKTNFKATAVKKTKRDTI